MKLVVVRVDVWLMREYGVKQSWIKLFSVEPSQAIDTYNFVTPEAYFRSSDQVLLHQDGQRFISFDLRKGRAKKVRVSGLLKRFTTQSCVGSLVELGDGWDEAAKSGKKEKDEKQQGNKKQDRDKKQRLCELVFFFVSFL